MMPTRRRRGQGRLHAPGCGAPLPAIVDLTPTQVLFGLSVVPALISTVIFAGPAPIGMTQPGIGAVPVSLVEAGEALGATRPQLCSHAAALARALPRLALIPAPGPFVRALPTPGIAVAPA